MPHLEIKVKDVFKVMFFINTLLTTNLAQNEKVSSFVTEFS